MLSDYAAVTSVDAFNINVINVCHYFGAKTFFVKTDF